jgi:DNA-binding phage protein
MKYFDLTFNVMRSSINIVDKVTISKLQKLIRAGELEKFLRLLRVLGQSYGMSELSKVSQLDRSNLYDILAGRTIPRLDTLLSVLSAFGLSLDIMTQRNLKKKSSLKNKASVKKSTKL